MKKPLKDKKLFIFDMDGTIYLGNRVFPFAVEFIKKLRADGKKVLFFTNNASKNPEVYLDRLTKMGFEPSREEIMTAGDVTVRFLLTERPGKKVFLLGTPMLAESFEKAGITLSDEADIVVTSFDTTLTYEKLTNACTFIRGGAEYLSTHPDFNCPTEDGFIPDSGAIAAAVTASTGVTPVYFGKPYPETVEMIGEITGEPKEKTLLFGDRLYTDIATGKRHGITAALVLTGETTMDDVNRASEAERPDLLLDSLADADRLLFGIDGNV